MIEDRLSAFLAVMEASVNNHAKFRAVIAALIAGYRAARLDDIESMRVGKSNEDNWLAQQTRHNEAIDEWGRFRVNFQLGDLNAFASAGDWHWQPPQTKAGWRIRISDGRLTVLP